MGFPSKKEIKRVLKKLENAEGTLALHPNATPLEIFRYEICQKFIGYTLDHHCSQADLAKILGIDPAKMSKILHHRIDEFSTDRLLTLYQKINPKVKLKVS